MIYLGHNNRCMRKNLTVVLLIQDTQYIKTLGAIFKEIGIHPYFYSNLKDFWQGTLEHVPSLAIVDVLLMSEGNLVLKNHPIIQNKALPIAFFHRPEHSVLLASTYELENLGTICSSRDLVGELKPILKRFNAQETLLREKFEQEKEIETLKLQLKNALKEDQRNIERITYHNYLNEIVGRDSFWSDSHNFMDSCEKIFASLFSLEKISIQFIDHTCNKLVSPVLNLENYTVLPDIFLERENNLTISQTTKESSIELAGQILGGDLISLSLTAEPGALEVLVHLKLDDEGFWKNFDWKGLEAYLSGLYRSFKISGLSLEERGSKIKTAWDLYEALENNTKAPIGLIDLNFSEMVQQIESSQERFLWHAMGRDFFNSLEKKSKNLFHMVPTGVTHMSFYLLRDSILEFKEELQIIVEEFPFWTYSLSEKNFLLKDFRPTLSHLEATKVEFDRAVIANNSSLYKDEEENNSQGNGHILSLLEQLEEGPTH
jgi:hypothetical protein